MRGVQLSRQVIVTGLILLVVGLILLAPSLWIASRFEIVHGRVREIFASDLGDGRVRLAVAYTFAIPGEHVDGYPNGVDAFGSRISDWTGRLRDDPVIAGDEVEDYRRRLGLGGRRGDSVLVYYDPDDPIATARSPLATGHWLARVTLAGLVSVFAPVVTWSCLLLLGLMRSSRRTPDPEAR